MEFGELMVLVPIVPNTLFALVDVFMKLYATNLELSMVTYNGFEAMILCQYRISCHLLVCHFVVHNLFTINLFTLQPGSS